MLQPAGAPGPHAGAPAAAACPLLAAAACAHCPAPLAPRADGKTFKKPRRPFEKERLDAELKLVGQKTHAKGGRGGEHPPSPSRGWTTVH